MNLTELNQTDHCLYFSCHERSESPALYLLLYVSAAAVVLLTVCGNLLIIVSVFHFKQLHTPTNMFVLSLAVSDFLIGVLVMPLLIIWMVESCWIFTNFLCTCFWVTASIFMSLSCYNIVLITVDRYFALSIPFFYLNIVSVKRVCVVVLCNWCVIPWCSLLLLYINGTFSAFINCPGECFIVLNGVSLKVNFIIAFIFPCTMIIVLYTGVFLIVKKHANAIREINSITKSQTHTNSIRSETKAAKVLGILMSVFRMSLLPYFFISLLNKFSEQSLGVSQKVILIFCLYSTMNPFVYALVYRWFRRCVKIIITFQIFQNDSTLMNVLS